MPSDAIHTTEFERQREQDEFSQAARLYRPLAGMIAYRFTRAEHDDDDKEKRPAESVVSASHCIVIITIAIEH